jgi:light-regulated signal transduction histidine kinase (bacteriophytochrome)
VIAILGIGLAAFCILLLARLTRLRRKNEQLEKIIAGRTAELQAANQELESFAYSISHDLQAPLRALEGITRILVEEYATSLPDEPLRYLQLVREGSQRMSRLLKDLLIYSRLGRQPISKTSVATTDLVRQVVDELSPMQEGRDVRVNIGDLPDCLADPALTRQVFTNLLENAFKFTRTRKVAEIEVGSYQGENNKVVYFVKDNGVGFDMQYADTLFGIFQRMHREEEYEGTGIGLASAQRIIHRHGGRIWAEAQTEQGAAFYFVLEGKHPHGGEESGRNGQA